MDRASAIFCIGSVIASLVVAWIAFPYAAMDPDKLAYASTPQPPELMDDVDVGEGFGKQPVLELMGYYVENPPAKAAPGAGAAPEIRFGGC